jgi:2-phospho-L-lactate guanylyltransferase (CobY/MobA/RfbA family)
MGAQAIDEGSPRGLNAAAALGTKYCLEHGAISVLIVLSDLPLITVDEIDSLFLDLPPEPHVRLARSHEGLGTNALLRTPPTAISTRFGGRSFQDHVAAAADANVTCTTVDLPGLSFDIDTIEDLSKLRRIVRPTRTLSEARKMGLPTRGIVSPLTSGRAEPDVSETTRPPALCHRRAPGYLLPWRRDRSDCSRSRGSSTRPSSMLWQTFLQSMQMK